MMAIFTLIGLIVVIRQIYLHIRSAQKLKAENACLRQCGKRGVNDEL